ncbi:hypothetical protein [Azospirillum sp. sgz301742]
MKRLVRVAGLAALAGLAACASNSPDIEIAQRAQTQLVGLPKAQLLSCAGVPTRQAVANGDEYYTYSQRPVYVSDAPAVSLGANGATGEGIVLGLGVGVPVFSGRGTQGCDATFVLRGGVVRQVSYPVGASLEDCGALVAACMPK